MEKSKNLKVKKQTVKKDCSLPTACLTTGFRLNFYLVNVAAQTRDLVLTHSTVCLRRRVTR